MATQAAIEAVQAEITSTRVAASKQFAAGAHNASAGTDAIADAMQRVLEAYRVEADRRRIVVDRCTPSMYYIDINGRCTMADVERIIFEVDGQFAADIRAAAEKHKPKGSIRPNVSAWLRIACAEKLAREAKRAGEVQ